MVPFGKIGFVYLTGSTLGSIIPTPGGLGAVFDWHVLENLDLRLPFMVSGGLNAGNVGQAVRVTRAGGVDVSSGVERAPGIKDPDMIRAFIRAARASEELMGR